MTSITFRKSYFPLTGTEICNALNADYRQMQGPKAEAFQQTLSLGCHVYNRTYLTLSLTLITMLTLLIRAGH